MINSLGYALGFIIYHIKHERVYVSCRVQGNYIFIIVRWYFISYKFLSFKSLIVCWVHRRGIEKANEELQQESELQMYEKGIIRQIPIFGSVFNWMSPIEDKKIAGRSFNLQSGLQFTSYQANVSLISI